MIFLGPAKKNPLYWRLDAFMRAANLYGLYFELLYGFFQLF